MKSRTIKTIMFLILFSGEWACAQSPASPILQRHQNGEMAEYVADTLYMKNGYSKLDAEVGRNGIDGLFIKHDKNGKIKDVIISEVKYGSSDLKRTKSGARQMSKQWKLDKINQKIDRLQRLREKGLAKPNDEKLLKKLKEIKGIVTKDPSKIKSDIVRIKDAGDGKFIITSNKIISDSLDTKNIKIGKQRTNLWQNVEIDMKKTYKKGSLKWKMQKTISHAQRKSKRIKKETNRLKELVKNQKKWSKDSKRYKQYVKAINKQEKKIKKIIKSRPKIYKTNNKALRESADDLAGNKKLRKLISDKLEVPIVLKKKGKKVLAFLDTSILKKSSKFKKLKFLKNVKGGDVVMMAFDGGVAVYSVLNGSASFAQVSKMLLRDYGSEFGEFIFEKGIAAFAAPPVSIVVVIAGSMIINYSIDKYQELDRRKYVGLKDMLWDVPDEIKNKLTGLNLEDTKRETAFEIDNIEKETVLDEEHEGSTILDDNAPERETIFE